MKVAIAIVKPEKSSPLSDVFGRSNFFLIVNASDNSEMILPNPFAKELGRAGIQTAKLLIENNVDAVIIKQIGKNPFRFLTSANIKVYSCKKENAAGAIRLLSESKLIPLEKIKEEYPGRRNRKRHGRVL